MEESPVGESSKVIIGEEFFEDLFLLLVLTKPIIPSAACDPEGAEVIRLCFGRLTIFSCKVLDCV